MCKILGAAAEEGYGFHDILNLGKAVTGALSSIAATLDHAHVPGRAEHGRIPDDTVEIGLGLHNEPVRLQRSVNKASTHRITGIFRGETATVKRRADCANVGPSP